MILSRNRMPLHPGSIIPAAIATAILLLSSGFPVHGDPITVKNTAPLFYGLNPPWGEGAQPSDRWTLSLSHASIFQRDRSREWETGLDMEITELRLGLRRRIGKNSELGVDLPILALHAGFMDEMIDAYHNLFGFPDYGRSQYPSYQFLYFLSSSKAPAVDVDEGSLGLGDIRFSFKQSLDSRHQAVSVMLTCELPTGSTEKGIGNGQVDWALSVIVDSPRKETCRVTSHIGVTLPGNIKAEQTLPTPPYFFYALLAEMDLDAKLVAHGDLILFTSPFESEILPFFNKNCLLITLGVSYRVDKHRWDISFMEDLSVSGAPDFTLQLSWTRFL